MAASSGHIGGDEDFLDTTSEPANHRSSLVHSQLATQQRDCVTIFRHLLTQPRSSAFCLPSHNTKQVNYQPSTDTSVLGQFLNQKQKSQFYKNTSTWNCSFRTIYIVNYQA